MERIVICCEYSEGVERLIAVAKVIFPECDIQVLSRQRERYGNMPLVPVPTTSQDGEKTNGRCLDY